MMILCIIALVFSGLVFLQRKSFFGLIFGLILLGNGINLSIFYGSNPNLGMFAFVDDAATKIAAVDALDTVDAPDTNDPLPQALVLTAIVIGFALLGFVVALTKRLAKTVGTFEADAMKREDCIE